MLEDKTSQGAVVIERSLRAPAELVWRMWTEPDHFAAWYGPAGARVTVARMEVRVGGGRLVCLEMDTPDGPMRMWFAGEYREVVANKRLVYTESMSDAEGNLIAASDLGMPADHPTTTEVVVELADAGGRTRMVMTHTGIPADSPGAAGWAMAFDKLVAHLDAQGRLNDA